MSGVRVNIWGPPLWKLLHTISFSSPHYIKTHSSNVVLFIENFKHLLPCKACRESFSVFLAQLPPLQEAIETGELALWMYNLHKKVNDKLGLPTPSFEKIVQRYVVRPVQWSSHDIWDVICSFGLNYTAAREVYYAKFWALLPIVVRFGEDVDLRVARLVQGIHRCPANALEFITTALMLEAYHENKPSPSESYIKLRAQRFQAALASGCSSTTC